MGLIQELKITTIAENTAWLKRFENQGVSFLLGQWGLSFLLELVDARGHDRKVIFDTGLNREALMHNIKGLRIDLRDLDCIVLSHGHLDHTGATAEVIKYSGGTKVYAHPHTFLQRFLEKKEGQRQEIGVPKGEGIEEIERSGGDVHLTPKPVEVVPGVWTTGQIERVTPFEPAPLLSEDVRPMMIIDDDCAEDRILDDQALWMNVGEFGCLVITGCAHAGLVNTLLQVQGLGNINNLEGVIGGTHLIGCSEEYLHRTVQELGRFDLGLISPCHCTGFKGQARLWQAFPKAFIPNHSGSVIEAAKDS